MLDTDTKRRIDTARDILVGKVPDPKSQVEQITIALIYKFMDDMDAEAEELGGKRKFFAGDYGRYGWAKLMRSGLGGHETLNLYAEAITKMPENPGIPPLFRDIFKNAYLPYRDPETLRAFLKIIDEFTYDHSERLGDAFEYLLSVLGSQGDAGQFRTPRHIIDFMVAIVDPKKSETVLDPACGTAGFLISSYKHILRVNTDAKGHTTLTPDDKGRLAQNFKGYDISPDMVRLSLVNLYLHGFTDPHIAEYDTLTSQDKWNEHADVILANPPFMSPKGGIKPHNRFSVQSKRSEVLFVDYMAEHLTPGGRAGIIVPEGIIFQNQTAYTQLRKMLIEEYVVAVVSLPAGVFNPYSGVKTSILILDKSLARQARTIAFFKIENDGFGLGAQRREIDRNDLPQARAEIAEYLCRLRARESVEDFQPSLGLVVPKERVAANGDYNLSGERYRDGPAKTGIWPMVRLGEITRRVSGGTPSKDNDAFWRGSIPWVSPKDMKANVLYDTEDHVSEEAVASSATSMVPAGTLLCVVRSGILKHTLPLALTGREMCFNQDITALIPTDERLEPRYLFAALRSRSAQILEEGIKAGVTVQSFHSGFFNQFQIPLPPPEMQKEIVAEIEGYQKVIDGARGVLDNYRPHIPIHADWPMVEIGELARPEYGFTASAAEEGDARFIRITDIAPDGSLRQDESKFITLTDEARQSQLSKGDILVARTGATYGKTMLFDEDYPAVFASYLIRLQFPKDRVLPRYYWVFAQSDTYWSQANALMTGGGQPQFNGNALKQIKVPLPPLPTQQAIVAEVEAEQAMVAANRELIARFEKKIQATLARVWGEDGPAPAEA
ncbi:MAG TPA: N-6 DNA methylase [Planctomycetota bacterium]|nr:N-6 DNA methylase [Planctomycetota bacterium]